MNNVSIRKCPKCNTVTQLARCPQCGTEIVKVIFNPKPKGLKDG